MYLFEYSKIINTDRGKKKNVENVSLNFIHRINEQNNKYKQFF